MDESRQWFVFHSSRHLSCMILIYNPHFESIASHWSSFDDDFLEETWRSRLLRIIER